jgi:hypothetical protein
MTKTSMSAAAMKRPNAIGVAEASVRYSRAAGDRRGFTPVLAALILDGLESADTERMMAGGKMGITPAGRVALER